LICSGLAGPPFNSIIAVSVAADLILATTHR
jgi:hypothetical protein